MVAATKHFRARLAAMPTTPEHVAQMDERTSDILGYHLCSLDVNRPLSDKFRALARDCYLQGLMDGSQLNKRKDIARVPLGA